MALMTRFKAGWNAFLDRPKHQDYVPYVSYGGRPDRLRLNFGNSKSIVNSVYNQIAVDVAAINIQHVRVNEEGRYEETINDSLNKALTYSANIDQTGRALIQDTVMSMLDEGCVAVIPFKTDGNPYETDSYKVESLRTAKILQWAPRRILVEAYNENTGRKEELWVDKRFTAIIENPFYATMNEPNSTAQRLIRVLNQLDRTNEQNSAGKMDLIIQLPYALNSERKQMQARNRRKEIEAQLTGSQYGIAYVDGTEKIVQLNRSVENNLWEQAKELTADLFNQLGMTQTIFDGTADEKTILNYTNRTIEPILNAITEEMRRKWISATASAQGQTIKYFRDPFKLVPVAQLAEISDKLTRNEITTSNEVRSFIGMKPSKDPKADELRNANLNHPDEEEKEVTVKETQVV